MVLCNWLNLKKGEKAMTRADLGTDGFLTKKQLAERWACCERTFERIVDDGLLASLDISGGRGVKKTLRFSLNDVRSFEAHNRKAVGLK